MSGEREAMSPSPRDDTITLAIPLCRCVGTVMTQANVCQRCGHNRSRVYGNVLLGAPMLDGVRP
jgi:hypothetical protein